MATYHVGWLATIYFIATSIIHKGAWESDKAFVYVCNDHNLAGRAPSFTHTFVRPLQPPIRFLHVRVTQ